MIRDAIVADLSREPSSAGASATNGMVTLIDLASLLLSFFVLSLSLSTYGPDHWQGVQESLARSFGPGSGAAPDSSRPLDTMSRRWRNDPAYLAAVLARTVADDASLQPAKVVSVGNRVVLAIRPDMVFVTHSGGMTGEGTAQLAAFAQRLRHMSLPVAVAVEADGTATGGDRWSPAITAGRKVASALAEGGYGGSPGVFAIGRGGAGPAEPSLSIARLRTSDDEPAVVVCICDWP